MDRAHLKELLNLPALPASVSNLDCESFGFTDTLERCAFEVSPADFPKLLAAYPYEAVPFCRDGPEDRICVGRKEPETSHNLCCGPPVGTDFAIAETYVTSPPEFQQGGSITVVADASRRHVMVDVYVE
jgi:hypothetical protein